MTKYEAMVILGMNTDDLTIEDAESPVSPELPVAYTEYATAETTAEKMKALYKIKFIISRIIHDQQLEYKEQDE